MMPSPEQIVAALADPNRLELFAATVVAGVGGVAPTRTAARHFGKLVQAGLVARDPEGNFVAQPAAFRDALAQERSSGPDDAVARLFSRGVR